jgi:hypothetical protein
VPRRGPAETISVTISRFSGKELADLCHSHGLVIEWADLLRDLDRLQEATIEKDGKAITTRTAVSGQVGSVFQAAGIALPPNLHERAARPDIPVGRPAVVLTPKIGVVTYCAFVSFSVALLKSGKASPVLDEEKPQ